MSNHDLQKPLETLPPMLNNVITEPVRKDLSRQRRNRNTCTLPLENIAEVLKVRVASAHNAVVELEGGNVGSAHNLVVGVHVAAHAVRAWVLYFNLEEVLWWAIDLFEALLARVWHCLHRCAVLVGASLVSS